MYEGTSVFRTVTLHEVIGWQKETKSTKTINKDSINNRINLLTLHSHRFVRGKNTRTHMNLDTWKKDCYHNNVRTRTYYRKDIIHIEIYVTKITRMHIHIVNV
jgi:hypothetical protein